MSVSAELKSRLAEKRVRRRLAAAGAATISSLPARDYEVIAYFPDHPTHLYQVRQWFEPFVALNERHPVLVLTRSARSASLLMRDCPLPVLYATRHKDIDPLIELPQLKVALYLSNNMRNFALLWHPELLHVFIGHGESDKTGVSASNQLKAYDFCFVSGQAGVDRIRHRLINYDTSTRCVEVGRPQVDVVVENPGFHRTGRTVVLYAPSWEGDRPASSYGSLASHGERIVGSLLAARDYQVIFRPHPLTGSNSASFAAALDRVTTMLEHANRRDPGAGHVIDSKSDFGWQLSA
ncbi:MAG: CDP-glycerol glycerophosphotransferase family protein, partial [Actinomycetes bacterium]